MSTWLAAGFALAMVGAGTWIGARLSRPENHDDDGGDR